MREYARAKKKRMRMQKKHRGLLHYPRQEKRLQNARILSYSTLLQPSE